MPDVAMPRLSDSMEEGTILKWLKSDGDEVARGEELAEIETDKANMTYEADVEGTLAIVAQEGDTVAVGETIARIGEPGESEGEGEAGAQDEEPSGDDAAEGSEEVEESSEEAQPVAEGDAGGNGRRDTQPASPESEPAAADAGGSDGGGNGRIKASPVAKRMARELGLELSALEGSGPGGRIVKADVEAAAKGGGTQTAEAPAQAEEQPRANGDAPERSSVPAAPAGAPSGDGGTAKGEVAEHDLSKLQQVVARRMAESKATAPDFALNVEVDMEEAVALRKRLKELAVEGGLPVPSFNDFVVKACAVALRDFPRANGAYKDGKFELYSRVNIGIAVAAQDSLVVPTVFEADRKSLGEIARDSRALAERVRAGAVTPPELSGGTFTVSNLGMFGIRSFTAVINPPQAAILAVGAMKPTAVVRDGELTVRNIMEVTLTCDHRILYGADAAEFLVRIRELLEQPLRLAL